MFQSMFAFFKALQNRSLVGSDRVFAAEIPVKKGIFTARAFSVTSLFWFEGLGRGGARRVPSHLNLPFLLFICFLLFLFVLFWNV